MRKFLTLLVLPLMLAVAACDMPPPEDGGVPADPAVTTDPAAPTEPAVE
ncbi:hypothetical protein OF122_04600 [Pelagibacterium flavum]|jgi:hypothetical protein|uniref:Uncharacterized protein n=1 Tax=Pelagibacterium flavum TaxID=2984530 RepID=A0ABY6IRM6_9HYPH|nr:hypothetical protein [Pelagibacterium sp. YIM 151497]UYQ73049.1 hypothetical protein OF122_04600 [Pelagibacterium sp. YIM 151497]|tara:strand:+ start:4135 stop:4281 length:147 start_codon:yes stop_codon:yes gene_type:complete